MSKNKRVFFIYMPLLTAAAAIFALSLTLAPLCMAQNDQPDATPEAAPPKIYTEQEISALGIDKLKDIAAAESIEQKSPLALYCLAQKYKNSGESKNCEEAFKKIISSYPAHYLSPKACLELASLYSNEKRASEEIEILNLLSSNYSGYSENLTGLYKLALIMKKLKNIDEMYKKFEEAEKLFAGKAELIPLLFMSANEYLRNYNMKKAVEKFENLLKIKELTIAQRAQALLGKAAAHEYDAEPEKAMMIYEEILKTRDLDKNILAMADKSKINLSKAPKTPLVKIEELAPSGGSAVKPAAETQKSGRVSDAENQVKPAAPEPEKAQDTSEVKARIKD
ncbi:MAG: hypothetical protein BWY32_00103 [bacterium ADurb.Bin243]|nr:MAG: hypothetical protein BWY32_00103 [bacterium ADurb.Bin243]